MRSAEKATVTTLAPHAHRLRRLSKLSPEWALPQAAHFLSRLVKDPGFLEYEVRPLLQEATGASEWYVARRHDDEEGSYSLQIFVWPPGSRTRIHDHSSWGVYCCALGSVSEERYARLDDGSVFEHARLKKVWQLQWSSTDGASTIHPGDGGIHRVGTLAPEAAVSVHLYGPRPGEIDGRDYDPYREYVCDRRN